MYIAMTSEADLEAVMSAKPINGSLNPAEAACKGTCLPSTLANNIITS